MVRTPTWLLPLHQIKFHFPICTLLGSNLNCELNVVQATSRIEDAARNNFTPGYAPKILPPPLENLLDLVSYIDWTTQRNVVVAIKLVTPYTNEVAAPN